MTVCPLIPSSRSTYFLNIVLYTFRHVYVDHAFQVLEIEPHTQGHCRYHNPQLAFPELLHHINFLFLREAGVINFASQPRVPQIVEDFEHDLLCPAIDEDAITVFYRIFPQIPEQRLIFARKLLSWDGDEKVFIYYCFGTNVFLDLQFLANWFHSLSIGCGSEAKHNRLPIFVFEIL